MRALPANAMAHGAAKLRIMLCFVRYVAFANSGYEKYYPKFGGPLKLVALCGRAYSKRGVQPKCGVQEASCGVQSPKMWSPLLLH